MSERTERIPRDLSRRQRRRKEKSAQRMLEPLSPYHWGIGCWFRQIKRGTSTSTWLLRHTTTTIEENKDLRMAATMDLSSDVTGGVLALILTAVGFMISSFAYPRLMGRSVLDAVRGGETIDVTARSMKSVRNWLGFWALSLTILSHLLSFSLEFGLLGLSVPYTSAQFAVILGGGRRFSNDDTGDIFLYENGVVLPDLFTIAIGACTSVETRDEYKMVQNQYPAIKVSQNFSDTSVSNYEVFECTSSWFGSAEWAIDPAGNLTIDLDSVSEQYRYEDVGWSYEDGGIAAVYAELITISYGFGTSFRGDISPIVIVNTSGEYADVTVISITEEDDHYVYSLSKSMEYVNGLEVLTGTFMRGHFRSSEYSLAGMVSIVLIMEIYGPDDSLAGMYYYSDIWFQSESTSGDYLVYNNPEGSEQYWPSLTDSSGKIYTDYKKSTQPIEYRFKIGEKEVTQISSWFFVVVAILAVLLTILAAASLLLGTTSGFWTYDGLSRMMRNCENPSEVSVIGIVGDFEQIGFVRGKGHSRRAYASDLVVTEN